VPPKSGLEFRDDEEIIGIVLNDAIGIKNPKITEESPKRKKRNNRLQKSLNVPRLMGGLPSLRIGVN